MLDGANLATVIVAIVGLLGMWGSHKIAARASIKNSRTTAEVEAYVRAVDMDKDTIKGLKERLVEVLAENKELREERRVWRIERAQKDAKIEALVRQNLLQRDQLREKNSGQENL